MAGIHLLDRLVGDEYPTFATEADVRTFEQTPYAERIAAESTYDAIRLGAAKNPDAPACTQGSRYRCCDRSIGTRDPRRVQASLYRKPGIGIRREQ